MFATHPQAQLRQAQLKLASRGRCFSYAEASRLFTQAISQRAKRIVIDLAGAEEATTSAFAELVLLRKRLLNAGGDLLLTGLRDRAAGLFQVNRLDAVLPLA